MRKIQKLFILFIAIVSVVMLVPSYAYAKDGDKNIYAKLYKHAFQYNQYHFVKDNIYKQKNGSYYFITDSYIRDAANLKKYYDMPDGGLKIAKNAVFYKLVECGEEFGYGDYLWKKKNFNKEMKKMYKSGHWKVIDGVINFYVDGKGYRPLNVEFTFNKKGEIQTIREYYYPYSEED